MSRLATQLDLDHRPDVNDRWARKELKVSERNLTNCGDIFTQFRRLLTEADGTVRRYEVRYTAEDEGGNQESYYDESGRLRFVIIDASAGNGSKLRHRIYFDENGKRLWEDHHVTGLGHHWPKTWPNSDLQLTNVRQAFSTTKGCEEAKPKSKRSPVTENHPGVFAD